MFVREVFSEYSTFILRLRLKSINENPGIGLKSVVRVNSCTFRHKDRTSRHPISG